MIMMNIREAGLTATYCLQMSVRTHRNVGFCAVSAEAPAVVQTAMPKAFHKDAMHSQF